MRRGALAITAALILLAGCGGDDEQSKPGASGSTAFQQPEALLASDRTVKADPDAGEELQLGAAVGRTPAAKRQVAKLTTRKSSFGDPDTSEAAYDRFMAALIPTIDRYWKAELRRLAPRAKYEPPARMVSYELEKSPGCNGQSAANMVRNAYYCGSVGPFASCKTVSPNKGWCRGDDVVAWDKTGLMYPTFKKIGDLGAALIMAHEWGHLIQARALPQFDYDATIRRELQADCYSGAWARDQQRRGRVTIGEFNDAIELFYEIGGGQRAWLDEESHGNKYQRTRTFIQGFEQGPRGCVARRYDRLLKRLGIGAEDRSANLRVRRSAVGITDVEGKPLEEQLEVLGRSANAYWEKVFGWSSRHWTKVRQVTIADSAPTGCRTLSTVDTPLFCPSDVAIFLPLRWIEDNISKFGDGASALLIGRLYGQAALTDLGYYKGLRQGLYTSVAVNKATYCLAGMWLQDIRRTVTRSDLQEAEKAIASLSDKPGDPPKRGSAKELTDALRAGITRPLFSNCKPQPGA